MSAINQEVAPERWPEWYAERRIDPIESGRRLEAFVRMRRAPYFTKVQYRLLNAAESDTPAHHDWRKTLKRDWAGIDSAIHS